MRTRWVRVTEAAALAVAAGLALVACGAPGESAPVPTASDAEAASRPRTSAEPPACDSVGLVATGGQPFERLEIRGAAGWLGEPETSWLPLRVPAEPALEALAAVEAGDPLPRLVVPVHASGAAGGMIEVELTDGERSCGWQRVEVLPMEFRSGVFESSVERSRALLPCRGRRSRRRP